VQCMPVLILNEIFTQICTVYTSVSFAISLSVVGIRQIVSCGTLQCFLSLESLECFLGAIALRAIYCLGMLLSGCSPITTTI